MAPPDDAARTDLRRHLDGLPLPTHALGRLEDVAAWLAACQARSPARPPAAPRVVLFAAEHGIAGAGVSAFDPAETGTRLAAVREGTSPTNSLATIAGADVRVVEVGDGPSGRIDREDALTDAGLQAALTAGVEAADAAVDEGADLLVPGELAVGVSTPTAVLAAAIGGREPVAVVGRGSGIDDHAWMRKAAAVRDALRRTKAVGRDPEGLLRVAGGADLAALVGFLTQAARRRTPVLLDGAAVCVAAVLADSRSPGARSWWLAATRDTEPAQALALELLGADPLLLLDLRAGAATGALAAVPLVTMAARVAAGS
ncbi:nicotinate-nucleotide--dimethylbenzimidazole phosphoribosyltransferase [Actinomycetospora sp. OC33-EN08]|uniref:Nicotinate-nucleotide--dimethylbenzimidazole phosphoribosyltransferase n=1 Tax=Actinomycetospora aurantiaca TaxID=3129233 RepID=A0ABU8MU08_9PSEU